MLKIKKKSYYFLFVFSLPSHVSYGFQFSVSTGLLSVQMSGFLFLVPSLGSFSYCLFVLSSFDLLVLFYLIISFDFTVIL